MVGRGLGAPCHTRYRCTPYSEGRVASLSLYLYLQYRRLPCTFLYSVLKVPEDAPGVYLPKSRYPICLVTELSYSRMYVHVDEAVMGLSVHTDEDGGGDNPLLSVSRLSRYTVGSRF